MRIIGEAVSNYTFQPLMTLITQIFHLYDTERLLFRNPRNLRMK